MENSVKKVDKFNRITKMDNVWPIYKMKCTNCGKEFFIKWDKLDDDTGTAVSYAVPAYSIDFFVEELSKTGNVLAEMLSEYDKYEIVDDY